MNSRKRQLNETKNVEHCQSQDSNNHKIKKTRSRKVQKKEINGTSSESEDKTRFEKIKSTSLKEYLGKNNKTEGKPKMKVEAGQADEDTKTSIYKSAFTIKSKQKNIDNPVIPPLKYESLGCGPKPVPVTGKKYVGCHVSAAGGIWMCFEYGMKSNADSMAMFLRNQRSWNAKPLDQDSIAKWNKAVKDFPRHLLLPHGSFLMNLGSPRAEVLEKSRCLFVEELQRCEKLGIPHYNFHPGSSLGQITREECCRLIAESINLAHQQTSDVICVIENMSKQGFTVGGDFHEIRLIIEDVEDKARVGVCIDTCHAHAAGYDLASEEGFNKLVNDFEKIIGWQFLRGLHINDSKGKVGDHKDRHENIGRGFIGREGFVRIMNYPRFNDIPLILETPFVSEEAYGQEIKLLQKMIE